jgi:hypothetical protein
MQGLQRWIENPLVKQAVRLNTPKEGEGADMRQVLLTLHDQLTELEERFPGVPFAEIIGEKMEWDTCEIARVRRTLKANGASPEDIALVCPRSEQRTDWKKSMGRDPYDERAIRL